MLRQSLNGLKAAGTNFYGARAAVEGWKSEFHQIIQKLILKLSDFETVINNTLANMEKGETEIMVPMTNTLLIRGKMVDAPMMVELGGGILMEKSTEGKNIENWSFWLGRYNEIFIQTFFRYYQILGQKNANGHNIFEQVWLRNATKSNGRSSHRKRNHR